MARFLEYLAVDYLDPSYHVWNNFMGEVFFQAMLVSVCASIAFNHILPGDRFAKPARSIESSPHGE